MKPKHTGDSIMGFVYMATCNYQKIDPVKKKKGVKENPSAKKEPSAKETNSAKETLLTPGTLLVKFGMSTLGNPTERITGLTRKFRPMEHKCHACYNSAYHKCIEQYLHAQFKEYRVKNLLSRLDYREMRSYPSQEHYRISEEEALDAFKKAIVKIEGSFLKIEAPYPLRDDGCSYHFTKGKVNARLKITEEDIKEERSTG